MTTETRGITTGDVTAGSASAGNEMTGNATIDDAMDADAATLEGRLYLDAAAGDRVRRDVVEAMLPFLTEVWGNPSSVHTDGRTAKRALEAARASVAANLGATTDDVVFTSGGTESDNLAVKGIALAGRDAGRPARVLVSAVEHPAVMQSALWLRDVLGFEVETVSVDAQARIDLKQLRDLLHGRGATLCCVMMANNEVGTIEPVAEAALICHESGTPIHVDAIQGAGTIPVDFRGLDVDSISVAGHKFGAPPGTGAWLMRPEVPVTSMMSGGGQERGLRPGTPDVAGAVALAVALDDAVQGMDGRNRALAASRDRLIDAVLRAVPRARLTGDARHRLPGHASFVIPGMTGETLLVDLDAHGIECSSGSACAVGRHETPPTLTAMGIDDDDARGALRFSFRSAPSDEEIGRIAAGLHDSCEAFGLV